MAKAVINLQKESGGIVKISPVDGTGVTEVTVPESGNLVSVGTAVTDNTIARYDGTTGKLQNSGVTIDDNGNIGVGVTPSDWAFGDNIDLGNNPYISSLSSDISVLVNAYHNNGWKYKSNTYSSRYEQSHGVHLWYTAPSGTAGSPITWTNAMILDTTGNLLLKSSTGALGYGAGAGGIVTQLTSKSTNVTLNKPSGRIIMNNEALGAGATTSFELSNNLMGASDTLTLSIPNLISNDIYIYRVTHNLYNGGALIHVTNASGSTLSEAISINFNLHKGVLS